MIIKGMSKNSRSHRLTAQVASPGSSTHTKKEREDFQAASTPENLTSLKVFSTALPCGSAGGSGRSSIPMQIRDETTNPGYSLALRLVSRSFRGFYQETEFAGSQLTEGANQAEDVCGNPLVVPTDSDSGPVGPWV